MAELISKQDLVRFSQADADAVDEIFERNMTDFAIDWSAEQIAKSYTGGDLAEHVYGYIFRDDLSPRVGERDFYARESTGIAFDTLSHAQTYFYDSRRKKKGFSVSDPRTSRRHWGSRPQDPNETKAHSARHCLVAGLQKTRRPESDESFVLVPDRP